VPSHTRYGRHVLFPILALTVGVAIAGCSGGKDRLTADEARARLEAAATHLNEASSVHVTVNSKNLPDSGTVIVRAEGVAVPPASFDGDVRIKAGALPATIAVISIDGTIWAQLPLTDRYERVTAGDLGFGDPGLLIDPEQGVSRLLTSGQEIKADDQVRIDGDVYDQIHAVLPGELVDAVLSLADPKSTVDATWALDPDTGRLRQATLTGPFYEGDGDQTYTVGLDNYDKPARVSAPTD
jgi:lipoprotein LprG